MTWRVCWVHAWETLVYFELMLWTLFGPFLFFPHKSNHRGALWVMKFCWGVFKGTGAQDMVISWAGISSKTLIFSYDYGWKDMAVWDHPQHLRCSGNCSCRINLKSRTFTTVMVCFSQHESQGKLIDIDQARLQ